MKKVIYCLCIIVILLIAGFIYYKNKPVVNNEQKNYSYESELKLNYGNVAFNVGDQLDLVADSIDEKYDITYRSLNEEVAEIDSSGRIIAKKEGTTTIIVRNGKYVGKCDVYVTSDMLELKELGLVANKNTLSIGETELLETKLNPENLQNVNITYTSSNSNIVSVDSNGNIKAVSPGTATITAKSNNNKTASIVIKSVLTETPTIKITNESDVNNILTINKELDKNVPVTYVSNKTTSGKNIKINISGNAKYYIYSTKTSFDEAKTDVNNNKRISINTPIRVDYSDGNLKVFYIWLVNDNDVKSTHYVRLSIPKYEEKPIELKGLKLLPVKKNILVGQSLLLETKIVPENSNTKITYTSSNNNIATVDGKGSVKGIYPGTVKITAKSDNNIVAESEIRVVLSETPTINITNESDKANTLTINKELEKNKSEIYSAFKTTSGKNIKINISGNAKYYIYSTKTSFDEAKTDVNNHEKISINTPINVDFSDGKLKVFYIWLVEENNTKSLHFTRLAITLKTINVKSISLNKKTTNINVNSSEKITATISPSDATNKKITWVSKNEKIATVTSSGEIKGIREGNVIITATTQDGNKVASINVNVKSSLFNVPRFMTMRSNEVKTISTKVSNLTWRTSNSNVARVNNGVVTAIGEGITNITAKSSTGIEEYIRVQVFNTNKYGCAYSGPYMNCSKKTSTPTVNKTAESKEKDEQELDYILTQLNYNKRYRTVEAAKYLALYYNTQVPYSSGETFYTLSNLKRLNLYSDKCWGCDKTKEEIEKLKENARKLRIKEGKDPDNPPVVVDEKHGIQCSGFVTWSLLNGGVKYRNGVDLTNSTLNVSAYLNSAYLSGAKSPYQWLIDNNKKNISSYLGSDDKNKIVSSTNIKPIKNIASWNDLYSMVKVGDLIGYGLNNSESDENDKGHIGIIVERYSENGNKYIVVAHSARWTSLSGVTGPQLTRYSDLTTFKQKWYKSESNGFSNIVLMDELYK